MIREADDPLWPTIQWGAVDDDPSPGAALATVPDTIDGLNCEDWHLSSFAPIQRFRSLRVLNISNTPLTSLEGIDVFQQLEILYADFGSFDDLTPLAQLPLLRVLDLSCSLADLRTITPVGQLVHLERLYLAHTSVTSIACLMHQPHLRLLSLTGTMVPDEEVQGFQALHPLCEVWV
jgi:Leucine-rich repeat (LRR) protein